MKKWRFISNQNSTIVGINDAGIETFTANMNRSLVREIIQNSLDAVRADRVGKEPVCVEFNCFKTKRNNIPDVDNLHDVMKKCMQSNEEEPDAYKFFKRADKILDEDEIDVLRISDYNTIGLEGSDTCEKGTSWSRLVKESGSSNKGKNSGGSFGIGKSAAFACSDLRTVFYSSVDSKGLESNFGVARLVSYNDDEMGWTTGVGYYSEDDRFVAIPELANIDPTYQRDDSGTDIYIVGMHAIDNFRKVFIEAVLLDFLVSISKGKLVVKIQNEIINAETLPKYMSELNPYENEDIKALLDYYHLLSSADPRILKVSLDSNEYGKKYGFQDGECTLYLKEGEGYNRKVMVTRSAGMRILELTHISGSIEFTGIMIIEGMKMNETFKAMEVPSHDAWEPGRCRGEEKYYKSVLKDFKQYIKKVVKDNFGKVAETKMDAFGVSDFLPDKMEEGDKLELKKNPLSTKVKKLEGKRIEPSKKKIKTKDTPDEDKDHGNPGSGGPGDGEGPNPGEGPHPGGGEGPFEGQNPGEHGDKAKGERKVNYKSIDIKKRLVCRNAIEGHYILNFIAPSTASNGKLEFTLAGEQSDYNLPIKEAVIISDTQKTIVTKIEENTIYLEKMSKGEAMKIELKVDFDSYCMMEVDYYANKK